MSNKLTIKDQFLTISQAKELQDLGIDVYGNFEIDESEEGYMSIQIEGTFADDAYNYNGKVYPTLSVAEMIEMLPKYLNFGTTTTILAFRPYPLGGGWIITYSEGQNSLIRQKIKVDGLLRDALFEMIKLLKQNKFI